MKNYVGIDLGTTNSAICSYDGENLKHYKSPEQYSVTPSAIYFGRRSRYYGVWAYNMAAREPENTATLFKRFMGQARPLRYRHSI
ncbi:MAG: Hsp70 family protein [Thermodesulfobacteriota bacterium]|nr:Hsp70 family protein [Thermodesulfobacteriota bacterium]